MNPGRDLRARAHKLKARRWALLAGIPGLRGEERMPRRLLSHRYLDSFCKPLQHKLLDERSGFGKRYLELLVKEFRVEGRQMVLRGSRAALARAVAGKA